MCTVVLLVRPGSPWPVVIGANRDEDAGRAWAAPGRHWADRPLVVAGFDRLAGGTWLGVNDDGLVAGVLNRRGSLGPAAGFRSRGEIPLEALDHATAASAVGALGDLNSDGYRPFNAFVADSARAYWLRSPAAPAGRSRVEVEALPPGLSMITAVERNDPASARICHYLPRFRAVPPPDPDTDRWSDWESLLASRAGAAGAGPEGAMSVHTDRGFATVSSSLIALPAPGSGRRPVWRFCPGAPRVGGYAPVAI